MLDRLHSRAKKSPKSLEMEESEREREAEVEVSTELNYSLLEKLEIK